MRFPGNIVTLADTRSQGAGRPDQCFYCQAATGGPHKPECVCIDRPVKVRMTLEMIVAKPRYWDANQIEFHLNESSWCADNIAQDVKRTFNMADTEGHECLCSKTEFEYLGEATLEEAIEAGLKPDSETD